jgi:hypothetical protein
LGDDNITTLVCKGAYAATTANGPNVYVDNNGQIFRSTTGVNGNAWSLTGNSLSGTEVLGSTNNQPVKLYTNNAERVRIKETGEVGIGTNSPNVALDINGAVAYRAITPATISASPQNNYNPGTGTFIRLVTTADLADYNISGIAGGYDGKMLIFRNTGVTKVSFLNQDGGSTDVNRIICSTGSEIELLPNHTITLIYDATTQRWVDIALR